MRIGIDLGGTKIEAIALREGGRELFRRRVDTPRGSYDGTIRAIAQLVDAADAAAGEQGTVGAEHRGKQRGRVGDVEDSISSRDAIR